MRTISKNPMNHLKKKSLGPELTWSISLGKDINYIHLKKILKSQTASQTKKIIIFSIVIKKVR